MSAWILTVYLGVSGWGVGAQRDFTFPTKESCYETLAALRIEADKQIAGEDDEQVVAICSPKE